MHTQASFHPDYANYIEYALLALMFCLEGHTQSDGAQQVHDGHIAICTREHKLPTCYDRGRLTPRINQFVQLDKYGSIKRMQCKL